MSLSSTPETRHFTALTHHLSRLASAMSDTEIRMRDMQKLLLAMQAFSAGQASQFMAVSHIVGQELEKEAAADEALAASSALASSGPAAAAPPSEGEAEDSLIM
ncbi:hypothetical protein BDY24DRAFT_381940 [Mrakia frigida]|uniref:uncharacterized protein n=1 Tax=Mrakia frigida TaxID=29902 RepID=UPI003FCC1D89